jgi:undecaprenyl-diphosphatase
MLDIFSRNRIFILSLILTVILVVVVQMGLSQSFDRWGVEFFRETANPANALGGESTKTLIMWLTHTGDSKFLAVISIIVGVGLYRKYGRQYAARAIAAFFGSFFLTAVLKAAFGRMRPDIVPQFVEATSASFPSGHTLRSTVVYFLVAFFFLQGQNITASRKAVIALAGFMIIMNGLSRIYLGVHWPTDVFAGWLMGACWVLICIRYLNIEK